MTEEPTVTHYQVELQSGRTLLLATAAPLLQLWVRARKRSEALIVTERIALKTADVRSITLRGNGKRESAD